MELSIALTEKILLKLLIDYPDYLLKIKENYFLSEIGKDLFEVFKDIHFTKNLKINKQNFILYGNQKNEQITEKAWNVISEIEYDINLFESEYYPQLKQNYAKDNLYYTVMNDLVKSVNSKKDLTVDKIIKLKKALDKNINLIQSKDKDFLTYENMLDKYQKELLERLNGLEYSIGCSYLDSKMGLKAAPKYITSIIGATGLGKSSYAIYLWIKQTNKGIPNVYFSLENDCYLTTEKKFSNIEGKNIKGLYNKDYGLSDELQKMFINQKRKAKNMKHSLFYEEVLSINEFRNKCIEAKKILNTDYFITTVDLASMFVDFGVKPYEIENSMNRLHNIARELNIHLILVFQANRDTDNKTISQFSDIEKLRPNKNSVKNSGAIAERSRVVLGLFRKKHYAETFFPDSPELELIDDITEVLIMKQNAGVIGKLDYMFYPEITQFIPYKEENQIKKEQNND